MQWRENWRAPVAEEDIGEDDDDDDDGGGGDLGRFNGREKRRASCTALSSAPVQAHHFSIITSLL